MVNRMLHTPSYMNTAAGRSEYWTTATGVASNGLAYYTRDVLIKVFDTTATGYTIGFAFTRGAGTNTNSEIAGVFENAGALAHCDLRFNQTTGVFFVTRNGTVLLTSTAPLTVGVEYYVEIQFVVHDTTGVAILKIDGVTDSVINSAVLDTRNGGTGSCNAVQFFGTNAIQPSLKDIYINDNTGGVDDTFFGPILFASMVMQSDDGVQWTPLSSTNASNVDEATADGDTTYNATSTNGHVDTFNASDTGYASGTVLGIEWAAEVRRVEPSATARVAPAYKIGGTTYIGSDIVPRMGYRIETERKRVSPATGVAWTLAELDGMKPGIKRTAA